MRPEHPVCNARRTSINQTLTLMARVWGRCVSINIHWPLPAVGRMEAAMQSLFDKFGVTATYVLSAIVIVVLLLVLLLIMRALFSRRLRPAGGRARQPRLGVVDAFDIDRQRQLVLVRRDNVEHLIMIGGPNDVVVESAIVRGGESRSGESRRQAIEEAGAAAPPSAPVAAPVAAPTPAPAPPVPAAPPAPVRAPAPTPLPPLRQPAASPPPPLRQPAPPLAAAPDLAPQVRSSVEVPASAPSPAPAPVSPPPTRVPPRVTPPPRSTPPLPAPRPTGTAGLGVSPPRSIAPAPTPPSPPTPAPQTAAPAPAVPKPEAPQPSAPTPSPAPSVQPPRPDNAAAGAARRFEFGRALQRATSEQAKTDQTPAATPPVEEAPAAGQTTPVVAEPSPESPAKVSDAYKPADPLDALEEEMAKLLGRPPGQS